MCSSCTTPALSTATRVSCGVMLIRMSSMIASSRVYAMPASPACTCTRSGTVLAPRESQALVSRLRSGAAARSAEPTRAVTPPRGATRRAMIVFPSSPGEEGAGRSALSLPRGGRDRVGAVQLLVGGARGRSGAQPTDLPFRSERTCDREAVAYTRTATTLGFPPATAAAPSRRAAGPLRRCSCLRCVR